MLHIPANPPACEVTVRFNGTGRRSWLLNVSGASRAEGHCCTMRFKALFTDRGLVVLDKGAMMPTVSAI